jgi:putative membrane-bound dehydrogenase-like protein
MKTVPLLTSIFLSVLSVAAVSQDPESVKIIVDPGFEVGLFAREPLVKDPVAFAIDPATGRIAVCESFRQSHGVEDNRSSPYWVLDDLAAQTVEDRRAYMLKWADKFEGGARWFTEKDDRIRMLIDFDGDGVADHAEPVADQFNDIVDGTGSGALWVDGDLWFTNIPHLWVIRDSDHDGVPDKRESLYEGFGVRTALRGHDMHGLTFGPDGRIYWSIGDRGYNVTLPDGRVLFDPHDGAVFRCERDGSDIEVFATGLRNPQELAFDRFGNLFTGDNNSDAGDRARLVYVAEGGETGWNMSYQTLSGSNERGPWNQEGIWWTERPLDPAWTLPPIAHVGAGPSGFAFYPGVGLPERYDDHLFLCDFRGADQNSSVRAFQMKPSGAGFELVDEHEFIRNVLATDVAFGPDGRVYVSDWGGGWESNETGQIYTAWHPDHVNSDGVLTARTILSEGFSDRFDDELIELLEHPHRDVRLFAQFELADRGEDTTSLLEEAAVGGFDFNARMHAAWALEMQSRTTNLETDDPDHPGHRLLPLLEDRDPEIRAQGARLVGMAGIQDAAEPLRSLLFDENNRVRYFAMMSLGRLDVAEALPEIAAVIAENEDRDDFLRHAGVMACTWLSKDDPDRLNQLAVHPSRSVRLVALLAMRRHQDPLISRFLDDSDQMIVLEAARAINDVPIREAWPELAGTLAHHAASLESETPEPDGPVVVREVWRNRPALPGLDLAELEIFETEPDERQVLDRFAGPLDEDDRYASRLVCTLVAPQTGEYVFRVSSDDDSVLHARVNDEASSWEIARVDGWVSPGSWEQRASQRSEPIHLQQGDSITLEARHVEGSGIDHVAVGWTLPDGTTEQPIGGESTSVEPWVRPLLRRAVNAAVRQGDPAHARMLADVTRNVDLPEPIRIDAMEALAEWAQPDPRDRVIGNWRPVPLEGRDLQGWRIVLATRLPGLVEHGSGRVRQLAQDLARTESIPLDGEINFTILADESATHGERIAALRQVVRNGTDRVDESLQVALDSRDPELRADARFLLLELAPERAVDVLSAALVDGELVERQSAVRGLGMTNSPEGRGRIDRLLVRLPEGDDPPLALDVLLAARSLDERGLTPPSLAGVETWLSRQPHGDLQFTLSGGDPQRGERLVRSHAGSQCLRCHRVGGFGGEAAPVLDGIGKRQDRDYLLQSMIDPSAVLVEGFGEASAMPPMHEILRADEIRDVIAYLATLKEDPPAGH